MGAVDPYALTDKLDDGLLQGIVTRLEARAAVRTSRCRPECGWNSVWRIPG